MHESQGNLPLLILDRTACPSVPRSQRRRPGVLGRGCAGATGGSSGSAMARPSSRSGLQSKPERGCQGRSDTRKGRARKGVEGWGRWQKAEDQKVAEKAA